MLVGLLLDSRAMALVDQSVPGVDISTPQQPAREGSNQDATAHIPTSEQPFAGSAYSALLKAASSSLSVPLIERAPAAKNLPLQSGLQIQMGRQRVDQAGTLFSNSHEKARTVGLSDPANRYHARLFGYRTPSKIQNDGTNLRLTPERVNSGASLQIDNLEQWRVQSVYFSSNTGEMTLPNHSNPDIDTWSTSAGRLWLDKSLETRIEYARTLASYNQTDALADDAIDIHINVLSMKWMPLPLFTKWTAGVHYRSVGDQYHSAPESYLPNGLDEADAYLQSSSDWLDINIGWRNENQERIDALGLLPRSQQRTKLALTYRPPLEESGNFWGVFGSPSLTTHFHTADQIEPGYATGFDQQALISDIDEQGVTLKLEQPWWQWSVQYQQSYQQRHMEKRFANDFDSTMPNLDRETISWSLSSSPIDAVSLNMNTGWNQSSEQEVHSRHQQRFYNFGAQINLIPNTVSMALHYNYAQNRSVVFGDSNVEIDTSNQIGSAEISWLAMPRKGNQPALELQLKSSYGAFGDHVLMDFNQRWAAQLSVNLHWDEQRL